ncbi:MAG: carboxypeptidase regulatory-like domain-containing protein [Planctomycetes bacterium]|nr:carboxypeptidase regulatory-like domain-containing protein [Planctomycetota bacterium]
MSTPSSSRPPLMALRFLALVLALANGFVAWRIWSTEPAEAVPRSIAAETIAPEKQAPPASHLQHATTSPSSRTSSAPEPERGERAPSEAATSRAVAPTAAREDAEKAPLEGTILFGSIRGSDGRALEEVRGSLYAAGAAKAVASFSKAIDGRYALAGLPSGTLNLRLRAAGYAELEESVEIAPAIAEIERDFVLERTWILAVKLEAPGGRPLHVELQERGLRLLGELAAIATPWEPSGEFPSTLERDLPYGVPRWINAQGPGVSFDKPQVSRDHLGHFELVENRPLFVSAVLRNARLATTRVEPGQAEVVLVIPPERVDEQLATLRLRVLDASSGTALLGARVGLFLSSTSGPGNEVDAEGRIEIGKKPPGAWRLVVTAPEHATVVRQIVLAPGAVLDLGDLALEAPLDLKVRCEGTIGEAKALAVRALPLDVSAHPALSAHELRLQLEGEHFVAQLPPGRYLVRASGAGGGAMVIELRAPSTAAFTLPLAPEAALSLRLATPGELVHAILLDAEGREILRDWIRPGVPRSRKVPVGELRLRVTTRAGELPERRLMVPAEGLELALPE